MEGVIATDLELLKTYGKVVGTYTGTLPCLLVADPDLIKQIYVKEFHNFTNRYETIKSDVFETALTNAKDSQWKFLRAVISPTFSSSKLKKMVPLINSCVVSLVDIITMKTSTNQVIEFKTIFSAYTIDVIASTAFGIEIDSQKQPNDPFVKHAKEAVETSFTSLFLLIAMIFPKSKQLLWLLKLDYLPKRIVQFFQAVVEGAIAKRKEEGSKYHDFLQLMLNAHNEAGFDRSESENSEWKGRGLSEKEISTNALIFFLAGYDTTSTALTFTAYCLAVNPVCQEKIIKEINKSLDKVSLFYCNNSRIPSTDVTVYVQEIPTDISGIRQERPNYDNISGLRYFDMLFFEVLRMFPPISRTNRVTDKTITLNGITISAGIDVHVPVFALHRDPEYWPDPDTFDPERTTKLHRNEVGISGSKMAIVAILQRFRFVTTEETEIPPTLEKGLFTRALNGVQLKMEVR